MVVVVLYGRSHEVRLLDDEERPRRAEPHEHGDEGPVRLVAAVERHVGAVDAVEGHADGVGHLEQELFTLAAGGDRLKDKVERKGG